VTSNCGAGRREVRRFEGGGGGGWGVRVTAMRYTIVLTVNVDRKLTHLACCPIALKHVECFFRISLPEVCH